MKKLLSKIEERTEHMESSHQERVAVTRRRENPGHWQKAKLTTMGDQTGCVDMRK